MYMSTILLPVAVVLLVFSYSELAFKTSAQHCFCPIVNAVSECNVPLAF